MLKDQLSINFPRSGTQTSLMSCPGDPTSRTPRSAPRRLTVTVPARHAPPWTHHTLTVRVLMQTFNRTSSTPTQPLPPESFQSSSVGFVRLNLHGTDGDSGPNPVGKWNTHIKNDFGTNAALRHKLIIISWKWVPVVRRL